MEGCQSAAVQMGLKFRILTAKAVDNTDYNLMKVLPCDKHPPWCFMASFNERSFFVVARSREIQTFHSCALRQSQRVAIVLLDASVYSPGPLQ